MVWGAVPAFSGCWDYMANVEWKISPFGTTGQHFSWRFRRWYAKVCQFTSCIHPSFVGVTVVTKTVSKQALQVSIYDLCIIYCFFISDSNSCSTSIDSRSRPTWSKRKRKTWSLPFHWGTDSSGCGENQDKSYHLKGFSPQITMVLGLWQSSSNFSCWMCTHGQTSALP